MSSAGANCGSNELEVLSRTLLTLLSNAPPNQSNQLKADALKKSSSPRKPLVQAKQSSRQAIQPKREPVHDQDPPRSNHIAQGKGLGKPRTPTGTGNIRSLQQTRITPSQREPLKPGAPPSCSHPQDAQPRPKPQQNHKSQSDQNCQPRMLQDLQGLVVDREVFGEWPSVPAERSERSGRHSLAVPCVSSMQSESCMQGGQHACLRQRSGSPIRQRMSHPNSSVSLANSQTRSLPIPSGFETGTRWSCNVKQPVQQYPAQVTPTLSLDSWWQSDANCLQTAKTPSQPCVGHGLVGGWGVGKALQR